MSNFKNIFFGLLLNFVSSATEDLKFIDEFKSLEV